jgi:O-antigen/teichoic acid export membrane protein
MARSALLSFLIAAAMLLAPHSAFIIGMIFMGSSILTLGLSIGLVSLRVPVGALPCPRASVVWRTLKDGFPFGLQVILATLYYQVDTMIVAEMLDVGMVGYYQASARLVLAVLPFAMLFINTFYPRLAGSYNSKTGDVECRSATAMMGILTVFGLVGTMVLGLFARFWILTIYGPKMLSSVAVLQILSLVLLIRSVAGGLGIVLIARRRQVVLVWAAGVATVVNVALNVLFIPRAGILACAWVNVFTNCIMLCIYAAALLVVKPATAVQVGHNA